MTGRVVRAGLVHDELLAEFALVLRLRGLTLEGYFATHDPVAGTAYYTAVLLLVLMPLLVNRDAAVSARG